MNTEDYNSTSQSIIVGVIGQGKIVDFWTKAQRVILTIPPFDHL